MPPPFMGLTHWGGGSGKKILKTDVSVAKNYLQEDELKSLGRRVNAYLELATKLDDQIESVCIKTCRLTHRHNNKHHIYI